MNLRASGVVMLAIGAVAGFEAVGAIADSSSGEANPYTVISDRNVFHLNPPPPPPEVEQKPVDLPKVMLSGFLKVGGSTRVLMAMPSKDPKEVTKYFNLAVGERDDPLELVKMNPEKGEVDIINTGTPQTLSLASNSFVASAAPAHPAGGPPPMPGIPGHRPPSLPPGMPPTSAPPPQAAASGGGSAIIIGGGSSGNSPNPSSYGSPIVAGGNSSGAAASSYSSLGSPIVAGGNSGYAPPAEPAPNNVGSQLANALTSPAPEYHMPTPPTIPASRAVQAASLLLNEKAGGPPAPPGVEDGPPDPGQ